jgi:glucose-1-phosphate thymidylyltransferase
MLEASQFIATIEHRQGLKIACPEEIAYFKRWIDLQQVERVARSMKKTSYGIYLDRLVEEESER